MLFPSNHLLLADLSSIVDISQALPCDNVFAMHNDLLSIPFHYFHLSHNYSNTTWDPAASYGEFCKLKFVCNILQKIIALTAIKFQVLEHTL